MDRPERTRVYSDMIAEAKLKVVLGERLDLKNGVKKDGTRITEIIMESGKHFAGKVFIDATSLMYLNNCVVDYVETFEAAGFKFENPNVKSTCGCGSSFSV